MRRIFRQCGSTALQESHLPVANRYSLPFSAQQEPRPPIFLVPRPPPFVPSEVGAQVLRDQQTEIRSMVWSWLHRQPQEFTA
jgi:hypothetical protein